MVIALTEENFEKEISEWVVLVDFWAEWCGPCQMMTPILHDLAEMMWDKAKISKLNVDESPAVASTFRVMSIPTLLVFKDGKPVEQMVWVQQAASLKAVLEKYI